MAKSTKATRLSAKDRAALEAGELLTHMLSEAEGKGVEAKALVGAPPKKVYAIVTDYERYAEFIPNVIDSSILEWESKNVCILKETLRIAFKKVEYSIRITHDRRKLTTRWVHHDGFLTRNDGGWMMEAFGRGKTLVHYRVAIETGFKVPRFIMDALTKGTLPGLFKALRSRVHER